MFTNKLVRLAAFIPGILFTQQLNAQTVLSQKNYIGIQPSFLAEPYDTIKALEVNVIPLAYEHRFANHVGIQFRPVMNYRFYKPAPGISQVGGTFLVNKYITTWFKEDFWLTLFLVAIQPIPITDWILSII